MFTTLFQHNSIKSLFLIACFAVAGGSAYAQTDTLYMNNDKVPCSVKEITPDAVKYTFPGEDVINTVYKNSIQKVVFKSGRVQTFAESTSFKPINSVMDYEKVTVTAVEGEVKGLYKLGDVSAKAKGTTVYSNQERVKERAYRKLKIEAAMLGANIVYLTNQRTEGNKYGGYFTSGSSSETNLTGVAYSNMLADFNKFKTLTANRKNFNTVMQFKLWSSDSDVSQDPITKIFEVTNVTNDNGITMIEGNLEGAKTHTFTLASLTDKDFSIAYHDKSTTYNVVVSLQ